MSKLDELIKEYCPNKVEYVRLCDITQVLRGKRLTKNNLIMNSKFPVFHGGLEPLGYYDLSNRPSNTCMIINVGASAGTVGFSNKEFWSSDGCYCLAQSTTFSDKYIYYVLKSKEQDLISKVRYAGIPTLDSYVIENLKIPLPPFPVQEEIVRILDSFTELTAKLTAELTAELTNRKKQYNYYRDSLLENNIPNKKLKNIVDIYLGLTYKPTYVDKGVTFISSQNISNDFLDLSNIKYISQEEYEKSTQNAKPKRGDILFTRVGSNLGHPVIVDTDIDLCMFVSLGYLRVKNKKEVLNSYLKYWMNTELFWEQVRKNVHGSAKVNLNNGWLKEFDIFVPSIEEQQCIVDILDRFDTLCNDITKGLPAEIKMRQQQYEYYRDKLLSFKELEN